MSSTLWPPAAAISSARRASAWPRTSAKSPCTRSIPSTAASAVSVTGFGSFSASTAS